MTLYQYNAKKVTYRAFESSRRYDEIISYNKNSAPLSLVRYGKNNTNQYTVIDALSYRYNGNQLVNVSDTCTHSLLYSNSFEYVNDNEGLSETEYTYDGNGNMTSDLNKGISSITYDKLNNPSRISYSDGKMINYDYSADGRKLSTTYVSVLSPLNPPIFPIFNSSDNSLEQPSLPSAHVIQDRLVSTASVVSSLSPLASTIMTHNAHNIRSISTTEYFGNYIFENGYLSTILLDDGYISFSVPNNSYILLPFDIPYTAPTFHFYLKDHLGSNRVVLSESGSVEQTNHYYPYGGMIGDLSTGQWKHPYKYNGKEYETMYGLNTYDYGARQYDPARITWDRMDKLCEKYYNINPYMYCAGDPVNRIDPDGRDCYLIIWASGDGQYGHAAFAIDNYKMDMQTLTPLPDGTVTVYGLFPNVPYSPIDALFDNSVDASYSVNNSTTISEICNDGGICSEDNKPDGIIQIKSDVKTDNETKGVMKNSMKSHLEYKGRSYNCSTFAREGVKSATGKDVKGQESFLGIKFVTPNSLFNDTKKMKGTKVLLSPGNKTKYDFNMKVKEYKSEKKN